MEKVKDVWPFSQGNDSLLDSIRQKMLFDEVVAKIASRFIGFFDIDEAINESMSDLGGVCDVSRIYIFSLNKEIGTMSNIYEWCANGVSEQIDNLQNIPISSCPWWMDKMNRGEIIKIPDISKMPDAAILEREILESQSIISLLVLPIHNGKELIGYVGFDDVEKVREFSDNEISLLNLVSQILGNAISFKKAEKKVIENEAKFRNIFDNQPAVKLIIDVETGGIIDANKAAIEYYGWTLEELTMMNLRDINNLSEKEFDKDINDLRDETFNKYVKEYKHKLRDGRIRDVEVYRAIVSACGKEYLHSIIHDVTKKKIAENNKMLLGKAIEQSPVSVLIADIHGIVKYVNAKYFEITGVDFCDIIGQSVYDKCKKERSEEFCNEVWNTVNSGKEWKGELRSKRKDGTCFWSNTKIAPIKNDIGEITHFLEIKEDISEKKRIIDDLVCAKEKAEESDRLKSAFLATMNHELRTPLNHILGFSDVIQYSSDDEDIIECAKVIGKSGSVLLDIIEDVFDFALAEQKPMKLRNKIFKPSDAFGEFKINIERIYLDSGKSSLIDLRYKEEDDISNCLIEADVHKINQVMLNLFKNAIRFTELGTIELGYYKSGDSELTLYVKDTGIGISDDKKDIIFDFFRQVDDSRSREYGGIGLGLAMSKKIVEALRGQIIVDSELTIGSEFRLKVPVKYSAFVSKDSVKDIINDINSMGDRTILIAEDDIFCKQMMSNIFEETDIDFLFASNGKEAIEFVHDNKIDLVLMDLKMPVMDGFEATKIIKENFPDLPVLAVTSCSLEEEKNKALEMGCCEVVSKSIARISLFIKIKNYLK